MRFKPDNLDKSEFYYLSLNYFLVMDDQAKIISLIAMYSYLGIIFYYVFFDFISPLADEVSLITIAYFSRQGMVNLWGAALAAFIALYIRNIILFYLTRNRTGWINKISQRYPVWMENYKKQITGKLARTIMILTFVPKLRILVPMVAGFGRVSKGKFFAWQAIVLLLFVSVFYGIGIFFHAGFESLANRFSEVGRYTFLIIFLLLSMLLGVLDRKSVV